VSHLDLIQRLQHSEEARLLVDMFPSFVSYVDREYRYRFINRAYEEKLGRPRDQLLGMTILEVWGEELFARLRVNVDRGLAGEQVIAEYHDARLGSITTYIPHRVDGEVVGVVVYSADARDIQATRAALFHSEKMAVIGRLVAGVLHELNSPLSAIKSAQELLVTQLARLTEGPPKPGMAERLLAVARPAIDAVDRVQRTLDTLKRVVHLDQAEEQIVDLRSLVEASVMLVRPQLRATVELRVALGEHAPLRCRPADLTQVFLAVLRRVADGVAPEGTIDLTSFEDAARSVFVVRYDGPPLEEALLRLRFQPIDSTSEAAHADLSWFIAHDLVSRLGGALTAENAEDGVRIQVEVPRA
jgi:PAS domain S-box-containing protein